MESTKSRDARCGSEQTRVGWEPRPIAARAVRAAQLILPFVGGWLAIRGLQQFFITVSEQPVVSFVGWLVQAIVVSSVVSAALVHLFRRLTPLVSLLNMSLVFPDSVPSRFGLALRNGTVKRLVAEPTIQLSHSAQEAAEQAVQLVAHLGKHDSLTRGHTERVRAYADVIGQQMGLTEEDLNGLRWGALLHDIGKVTVPPEILNKPGKPNAEEWEILRGHPGAAVPILKPLEAWLGDWLRAAPEHHEKWDGSGYPLGLSGNEISLPGRIVAVADAYDVITSKRSYKEAMSPEAARSEMVRSAGSHFDPTVVRALLEAGVTQSGLTRRMGWVLELPSVGSIIGTAGHAATAAATAVVVSAAVTVGSPVASNDVPDAIAWTGISAADSLGIDTAAAITIPVVPSTSPISPTQDLIPTPSTQATSGAPTTTSPTVQPEISAAPSTTSASAVQGSPSTSSTIATAPSTPTTVANSVAPATTVPGQPAQPTTTTTSQPTAVLPATTTTTTTTVTVTLTGSADCRLAQSGETQLAQLNLRGCDLSGLSLAGVDLSWADLRNADLSNAVITDFNMAQTSLNNANLDGLRLERGTVFGSSLLNASARGVSIIDVDFANADMRNIIFSDSSFTGVSFTAANLSNADFLGSSIAQSNFNEAQVGRANFSGIDLSGIEFNDARIGKTNLSGTNLTDAKFAGTRETPEGHGSATFFQTTCPTGVVQSTDCWDG